MVVNEGYSIGIQERRLRFGLHNGRNMIATESVSVVFAKGKHGKNLIS